MVIRYTAKDGRFADVELSETDRLRIDHLMREHGFAPNSGQGERRVEFAELSRILGGSEQSSRSIIRGPSHSGGTAQTAVSLR